MDPLSLLKRVAAAFDFSGEVPSGPSPDRSSELDSFEGGQRSREGPQKSGVTLPPPGAGGVPHEHLRRSQAVALVVVERCFTNTYGDDGPLREAVAVKLPNYRDVAPDADALGATLGAASEAEVSERMREALRVLLGTFLVPTGEDWKLRLAVIDKLGKLGKSPDVEALRSPARKGRGRELKAALEAITAIATREGTPDVRGGLAQDPKIGHLLRQDHLTSEQRREVIEAVLRRGTIARVSQPGGTNWNEVYFVTFEEGFRKGGETVRIEGVFKPEPVGDGSKKRAFFSREVAAYQLDRLAGTGAVVPTVESIVALAGEPPRIGCMQHRLPRCRELGKEDDRFRVHDSFAGFIETEGARKDLDRIRLISYVLGDTDHFANTRGRSRIYNYNNFLVTLDEEDEPERIVPIDWGSSLGVPDTLVLDGILPASASTGSLNRLQHLSQETVEGVAGEYIETEDARDVGARVAHAVDRLEEEE